MNQDQYVLVTLARDEKQNLPALLHSVAAQTWRPALWLVVDDGSVDGTSEALQEFAESHNWTTVVQSPRAPRSVATRLSSLLRESCNRAISEVPSATYIGVLDADMSIPADYFRKLRDAMDPRIVIVSGAVATERGVEQGTGEARGGCRLIARKFYDAVGGIPIGPAWDSVMNLQATARGLHAKETQTVRAYQARPTGANYAPGERGRLRGSFNHFVGKRARDVLLEALFSIPLRQKWPAVQQFFKARAKGETRLHDPFVRNLMSARRRSR